jgi:arsenite methyltransferase
MNYKKCCSEFYQTDYVKLLFGDSMHPGGLGLTKELAERIEIVKESNVLDVACGLGTSAISIAKNFHCHITGIDLSEKNVAEAERISIAQGVSEITKFIIGDAENVVDLFKQETFDCSMCECSFCLFEDKKRAAEELYKVTRKNGKIGISDIVVRNEISLHLRDALSRFLCVLEAKSEQEYKGYLKNAGFTNIHIYDKKHEMLKLLDDIMKRMFAAELLQGLGKIDLHNSNSNIDLNKIKNIIKEVKHCVNSNTISYVLIVGDK